MITIGRRCAAIAVTLCALVALSGCKSKPEPQWVDATFDVRSENLLWTVLRQALDRAEFAVGSEADPSQRRIVSAWKVDASPFKGRGFRSKAHVEFSPSSEADNGQESGWAVRVRVEKETNESFKGLDLRYAEWKAAPDDVAAAGRIVQFARSLLGGGDFEVNPEPDRRPPSRSSRPTDELPPELRVEN